METVLIPELVKIVAEYALIPADIPEEEHWSSCTESATYAQWWPIIELVRVCSQGLLEFAIWLTRAYIPPEFTCASLEVFWEIALVGGKNSHARRPREGGAAPPLVPLSATGTRASLIVESGALLQACRGGHTEVVQWLVAEYRLTSVEIRSFYNRVLTHACASGNVELIDWLRCKFNLSEDDAREKSGAFVAVCCSGNLEALQWAAREFKFDRATVNLLSLQVFIALIYCSRAAPDCELHIAQWVVDTFGLTRSSCREALGAGGFVERLARSGYSACPEAILYWLNGVPDA